MNQLLQSESGTYSLDIMYHPIYMNQLLQSESGTCFLFPLHENSIASTSATACLAEESLSHTYVEL